MSTNSLYSGALHWIAEYLRFYFARLHIVCMLYLYMYMCVYIYTHTHTRTHTPNT